PRVGDVLRRHLVEAVDVVHAHQAGQADVLVALVELEVLLALDQQGAVGQHAVYGDGDRATQGVLLRTLGRAVEFTLAARRAFDVRVALAEHGGDADADARLLAEA